MEEIKKKMREDFEYLVSKINFSASAFDARSIQIMNSFAKDNDSLIDLAVSKEQERVTSKTDEVWDLLCQMDTNIKSEKEYAKDIINLINNK